MPEIRAQQKEFPDFWARVYRPDALLLEHLRAHDLADINAR